VLEFFDQLERAVDEDRAAIGLLEDAKALRGCASECTALMSE
jgi:hypothetical protein